jgi:hypothetical protein
MNVGIGTEAAQFLFWEYINSIFGTMQRGTFTLLVIHHVEQSANFKIGLIRPCAKEVTFFRVICNLAPSHSPRFTCSVMSHLSRLTSSTKETLRNIAIHPEWLEVFHATAEVTESPKTLRSSRLLANYSNCKNQQQL